MTSVLVFGPTGQVGSNAALTASEKGATVWLAMRDTNKAIPGLTEDDEKAGNFHRVQADLQDTDSIHQAVKTSGAKRVFFYLVHQSKDHMKSTIEAFKSAGVEFVVFLSSYTIPVNKELREIPRSEIIPFMHAQVEANLDDIYGEDHYVAMRPGAFITNLLAEKKGIVDGHVKLYGGSFEQDNITPGDIGRVAGTVLVSGPKNGQKKVYVYGPQIQSMHDGIVKIGKTLGKDVQVADMTADEARQKYLSHGLPEVFANYMVNVLGNLGGEKGSGDRFPKHQLGVENVTLYTGRSSTSLEEWVKENKAMFSA